MKVQHMGKAGLLAVLLLAVPAFGDIAAFAPPAGLDLIGSGGAVNLGLIFTVSNDISVDALGFYDIGSFSAAEPVALYDSSGNLLTQTVVSPGTDVNGYFYQAITPITLKAGNEYVVDALALNGAWAFGGIAPPTTAPGITYDDHVYDYTNVLTFPTNTAAEAATAYYGPNFEFSAVTTPEPAFYGVLAAGMAGLLFHARRRRNTASI